MSPDLERLAAEAAAGERHAAVQIIEALYAWVYAFLRRLAGNEADAADLTQRTFSRVWENIGKFAGRSSVSSWVHGIAYHVYADWRRSNSRMESRPDEWWMARASGEPGPDEDAGRFDLASAVYAQVDALEAVLRDCVHLHYYQELTIEETADVLGVATSTVKYRLRQAIAELQRRLAEPAKVGGRS